MRVAGIPEKPKKAGKNAHGRHQIYRYVSPWDGGLESEKEFVMFFKSRPKTDKEMKVTFLWSGRKKICFPSKNELVTTTLLFCVFFGKLVLLKK